MKLSVIVPAYNEEEYLPDTLKRIVGALSVAEFDSEIIVVDNESEDRTQQIAESFGAKVFSENERNIGKVRNTGAESSSGDILVFIDADTLVPETLFREIAAVMEDRQCFGGAVALEYVKLQSKLVEYYLMLCQHIGRGFNMKQGAAQFCRRFVFEKLAGYDQTIFVGEDVEFYWRLSKFARRNHGYLCFIEQLKVTTSARRFNKIGLWKTVLVTHPIFIGLNWRKKSSWKDWYENAIR